jgi:polyferredoxin
MKVICEEESQLKTARTEHLPKVKKRWIRRRRKDRSQHLRHGLQGLFLALNVWIGIEFLLFVRYCESGGTLGSPNRPAGVEGWLPIAALMNLKYFLLTAHVPRVHPAAMFLLLAFLSMSWVFRKSFCGWLCPIGTLSEMLWTWGRRLFGRNLSLTRWLDIPLRGLKYLLLGLFLYAVGSMPPASLRAFMESPYGLIADVKMLNFFRDLSLTGLWVLTALLGLSLFVKNFWCRYLCPYGALMGLVALLSPSRIRRESSACIDCAKCARVCPALLPVDRLQSIRSAECIGCLECVAVCPAEGALQMSMGSRKNLPAWALAAGVVVLFVGIVGYAKWSGHWQTDIPQETYFQLVPKSQELGHP